MFRGVSPMRIFSSFGHSPGNTCFQFRFSLRQISNPRFSDVGTTVPKAATSLIQIAVVRTARALPGPPVHPVPADPPPGPSPRQADRARSLPPHNCARGRKGLLHFPYNCRFSSSLNSARMQIGARPQIRSAGLRGTWLRGTRRSSEVIHVQVRRLVHPDPVQLPAARRSSCGSSRRQMSSAMFSVVGTSRSKGGTS